MELASCLAVQPTKWHSLSDKMVQHKLMFEKLNQILEFYSRNEVQVKICKKNKFEI